ncbi:MAG: transglycosylase domain-containing protein [Oscillospiraceae bacterium]|nr:transglycosylase domain-containing protein [Oscillospiraceae bacterium]
MTNPKTGSALGAVTGFFKWVGILLGTIVLIGAATCAILACYAANYVTTVIMDEVEETRPALSLVQSNSDQTTAILYYDESSGTYQPEQILYDDENRVWVTYEDIPQNLINATVAIEDKRFWDHGGVDWVRTGSAVLKMFTGGRQEGGSTITQQLIKNVTKNNDVTVKRKVLEIFQALEFDSTHTKEETLEWYLNKIFLGNRCYGVYTAAQFYYGKDLEDLSLAECAALISITNNPSAYNPLKYPENNYKRRCLVLDQMCEQGYISEEARDAAKAEELVFTGDKADTQQTEKTTGDYYSWYTETVIKEVAADLEAKLNIDNKTAIDMIYSGGLQIFSCLDRFVQDQVDAVYIPGDLLAGHKSAKGQELISAISVIDNDTGAVIAIAGGTGEKTGNRIWNTAYDTLRPPGSTIKPLSVYAPAIEMGAVTPTSLIEDSSLRLSDGTLYPTSNAGKKPTGDLVTVDYALSKSLNTVAAQLLQRVSPQYSFNFLQDRFGITSLVEGYTGKSGKFYSDLDLAPLALGGLTYGISVYELAGAYSVFPRDGLYVEPYVYTVVTDSNGEIILAQDGYSISYDSMGNPIISGYTVGEAVLKDSTVRYMDDMLENVVSEGTGTGARISGVKVAGKTGTTDEDYDRWFAGYTDDVTAVVWTGYENSETINYDGNPAVVLWKAVMARLYSEG